MLQQTRAAVVVPYFLRWIKQFPTVQALAEAPLERVIKAWEGLGYYSRARNSHRAAQEIVSRYRGALPGDREALLTIPGIGPYTASAIASFAFHQRAVPLDGNVMRAASRVFWISGEIEKQTTRRAIEEAVFKTLDEEEPWVTAEAWIELGATLCTPLPKCAECPLRSVCKAALQGTPTALPQRRVPERATDLIRTVVVMTAGNEVLIKQGERGRVMEGLWEFPYFENGPTLPRLKKHLEKEMGASIIHWRRLAEARHSFTKYRVRLVPFLFEFAQKGPLPSCVWVDFKRLQELPFSAGHRRVLQGWREEWKKGEH